MPAPLVGALVASIPLAEAPSVVANAGNDESVVVPISNVPDAEAVGVIPEMPVAQSIEAVDVAPEKSDAPNIEAVAVAPLAEKSDTPAMAAGEETKPADNTLETEISNFFDDDLNFDIDKYKAWEANAYAPLGEAPTAIESVAPDALVAAASDASASDAAAVAASEAVVTPPCGR